MYSSTLTVFDEKKNAKRKTTDNRLTLAIAMTP